MTTHRTLVLGIIAGLVGMSAASVASAATHGMGLKPSGMHQAAIPLSTDASISEATLVAALPARIDLSTWAIEPGDQKEINSCVGWAVAHTLTGWYAKAYAPATTKFAPMYVYSQINVGGPDEDNGAYAEDAFRVAISQGIDTERHYTRGGYDWKTLPSKDERINAGKHKPVYGSYTNLFADDNGNGGRPLINALKQSLANATPVAIGFAVRDGFYDLNTTNDVDYDISSPIEGYHEVIALGYDQDGLLIENSWGKGWGNKGFARLSWSVVAKDIIDANVVNLR
ncbi:C1 family peptidase [Xanthomonas hortorum pv. vitians]|uniref:C1 family peptidase n=4 Tax=Xanthomonas hortorum TaxID=56454 RepID=A0A6V7EVU6_9XANT|nr:C1 family peptidase [Xanthomonas hortorum]ASW44609.1 peptidase C1 [Xanthomonas hortorum]MCC8495327.1 C1 family peptidase [Xanthomonas hortorum pv. gardneri]MCE4285594.1 C1 family peptidase [Xanthomonas hortorum pv. vitians]MCE4289912.1 C1 family peptidase [Xanthomonas hortorum pv. vitians]MCE4293838.1 C1 family peptidase [Xanthomonas hortorum pv. vitians]